MQLFLRNCIPHPSNLRTTMHIPIIHSTRISLRRFSAQSCGFIFLFLAPIPHLRWLAGQLVRSNYCVAKGSRLSPAVQLVRSNNFVAKESRLSPVGQLVSSNYCVAKGSCLSPAGQLVRSNNCVAKGSRLPPPGQ